MNIWKLILVLIIVLPSIAFAQQNHRPFDIKNYDDTSFVLIGNEYGTNVGAFVSDNALLSF
ncbi:hypothetical protein [Thalassotalea sp. G2M2-11]|uniref:hypothetical protein n=1 Tax=Thalassotalea sp. G2M2-11 TaxID=2787627 RepID=UPI0019D2EE77|nr:hypothetical protein [Thalassotalea sp. G2M2-11]